MSECRSLSPGPGNGQPGSLTRQRPGNTRQPGSTRQPGTTRQPGSRRGQTSCEDVRTGTRQPGNTRQHPGSDPATRQHLATPLISHKSQCVLRSRCLVVCGKCVRGITQVCSPLQITPRAVLRLKLRPPSVESAKQLRNQLRLHFQVSRLAPSDLNPPYFVLPPFLFVEFHFQRLRMHCRYQIC